MKCIGLLGGVSWESSIEYYRILNELVRERLGGLHSAKCVMFSVDFQPVENLMMSGKWDELGQDLTKVSQSLEKAGADFIIICSNTTNIVAERIQPHINIPILHIADATVAKIEELGIRKVGLLGTKFTMEGTIYKSRLDAKGIQIIIPNDSDRILVNDIIFDELCLGKIKDTSREIYKRIIHELKANGAEAVILGCTEIPLLISQNDSPIPVLDTTYIHAEYAISKAFEE